MEWFNDNWWWIVAVVVCVLGIGLYVFRKWRETHEGDELVLDLVELVLKSLHEVFQGEMHKIDRAHVINAARDVHRRFIAPTPLGQFVSQDEFVDAVLEAWRHVAGVEEVVALAVARTPLPDNGHGITAI